MDLSTAILLEPCAGEGAILVEAVERLIVSLRRHGYPLAKRLLLPRIKAFEFYGPVAARARRAIRQILMREGISWATSGLLADTWVRQADFLLQSPENATHVVANPPYLRWSKLPLLLAEEYRAHLRSISTRGDIAVAFLDRMLVWAGNKGKISALVSDRWMFAQYGAAFVADLKENGWNLVVVDDQPVSPFVRHVGVSSAIVRLDRKAVEADNDQSRRDTARTIHARLLARHGSLDAAGCTVKVGPALGCGDTFLVSDEEAATIEVRANPSVRFTQNARW
ncbi:Eco57I restriction-modification methylase domain-containing protein [Devosia riboflavina]